MEGNFITYDDLNMIFRISYYGAGIYYAIFHTNAKRYGFVDRLLLIGVWLLDLILTKYYG